MQATDYWNGAKYGSQFQDNEPFPKKATGTSWIEYIWCHGLANSPKIAHGFPTPLRYASETSACTRNDSNFYPLHRAPNKPSTKLHDRSLAAALFLPLSANKNVCHIDCREGTPAQRRGPITATAWIATVRENIPEVLQPMRLQIRST
jgi:hypothetical protein